MTPHLIFDGYNLIHSSTFSKNYSFKNKNTSIQDKRERLIEVIAKYIKGKNIKATIVFDSPNYYVRSPLREQSKKLSVIFANTNENADERIVKLALSTRPRSSITVISSDEAHIGGFLRGCGLEVIKVEDFWTRIFKSPPLAEQQNETLDKPQSLSAEELKYWENVFDVKKK